MKRSVTAIQSQGYGNVELLVGFEKEGVDASIRLEDKVKKLTDCQGLKPLLNMANGDYVAVVSCGDALTADAIFEVAKVIENQPDVCLIYADEDSVTQKGEFLNPHFKTDYNYHLLLSYPYMGRFVVFNKAMLNSVEEPFDVALENAAVYGACLKIAEKTDQIVHVPKVLNHVLSKTGALDQPYRLDLPECEPCQKALESHLRRTKQDAKVLARAYSSDIRSRVSRTDRVQSECDYTLQRQLWAFGNLR